MWLRVKLVGFAGSQAMKRMIVVALLLVGMVGLVGCDTLNVLSDLGVVKAGTPCDDCPLGTQIQQRDQDRDGNCGATCPNEDCLQLRQRTMAQN